MCWGDSGFAFIIDGSSSIHRRDYEKVKPPLPCLLFKLLRSRSKNDQDHCRGTWNWTKRLTSLNSPVGSRRTLPKNVESNGLQGLDQQERRPKNWRNATDEYILASGRHSSTFMKTWWPPKLDFEMVSKTLIMMTDGRKNRLADIVSVKFRKYILNFSMKTYFFSVLWKTANDSESPKIHLSS